MEFNRKFLSVATSALIWVLEMTTSKGSVLRLLMAGAAGILSILELSIALNSSYLVLFLAIPLKVPTSLSTTMKTPLACPPLALRNLSLQIALSATALWQTGHRFVNSSISCFNP